MGMGGTPRVQALQKHDLIGLMSKTSASTMLLQYDTKGIGNLNYKVGTCTKKKRPPCYIIPNIRMEVYLPLLSPYKLFKKVAPFPQDCLTIDIVNYGDLAGHWLDSV